MKKRKIKSPPMTEKCSVEAIDWGWIRIIQSLTTLSRAFDLKIDMDPPARWLKPATHRSMTADQLQPIDATSH